MNGEDLKHVLREAFDARVLNYGDFNLVYGQPSGAGNPWVIGYRWQPLELLLCPVDLEALPGIPDGSTVATVALGNVATLADTGTGYQVETVTGFRTWFEVSGSPRVPLPVRAGVDGAEHTEDTGRRDGGGHGGGHNGESGSDTAGDPRDHAEGQRDDGTLVIRQEADAEDFHQFMSHFMDILDSYYREGADPA